MKPLKIIYCGAPDFATAPLESLAKDARFLVEAVISQPSQPNEPPVARYAKLNNLIVLQPEKIASEKQKIAQLNPDFIVVTAYGQLIPREILEIPRFGCVNIHFSLLPHYRGASPVQEALLRDDKETGLTYMMMAERLDAGPILKQSVVEIENDDTAQSLLSKLSALAARELPRILLDLAAGKIEKKPQDEKKASYTRKITKEDGLLNPLEESAHEIVCKIRAYTPWPGAYIFVREKRLKITKAEYSEQKNDSGKWIFVDGKLGLGTKEGTLFPKRVQMAGKKELAIEEFLKGNRTLFDR